MSSVPCSSSIRFLYWSFSLIDVDTLLSVEVDCLLPLQAAMLKTVLTAVPRTRSRSGLAWLKLNDPDLEGIYCDGLDRLGNTVSDARNRFLSTARRAAISAILTDILSRSDKALTSRTVDAPPGKSILVIPSEVPPTRHLYRRKHFLVRYRKTLIS